MCDGTRHTVILTGAPPPPPSRSHPSPHLLRQVGYIPASLSIATRTPLPSSLPWGVSIAVGAVRAYPALTRALAGKEGAEQMVGDQGGGGSFEAWGH